MDFTQPTQTQPTQQPMLLTQKKELEKRIGQLICTTGQYATFQFTEDKKATNNKRIWTFGRNNECDLIINNSSRLSNKHFNIYLNISDKSLWIQDTSTNGTYLNSTRLVKNSNYILNQGDEISVGLGVKEDVVNFIIVLSDLYNPKVSQDTLKTGIYKDYEVKEVLGHGAFATVKKCINRQSGSSFAVKIINRRKALNTTSVDREISILQKLNHPNIVSLKEFHEDMDNYYIIMELVPGGDLMDFVAANGAIGEDATQVITKQILQGISYVHSQGISHRDLKPDNILIAQDDPILVKITDFGLAKISDNFSAMKTFCGTLAYVAPEIITGKEKSDPKYLNLVDIWSLGCLVYVLLTSHLPFNGKTQLTMFQKIKKGDYHQSPLNSYQISDAGRDFLKLCLQVDPSKRINAKQALDHYWIQDAFDDEASPLSLSQSQSQQSRKIDNGLPIDSTTFNKIEDIMMRPLDSDKNKKKTINEFKIPKRVVPLPQSQPLKKIDEDTEFNDNSPSEKSVLINGIRISDLKSPTSEVKNNTNSSRKRALNGLEASLDNDSSKKPKVDINSSFDISVLNSLTSHPPDTFITLVPLENSQFQTPIHIRQGVNPYSIGRNEVCDTYVNDDRMSKVHCLLHRRRHPTIVNSIYESPAHCLDDLWLLDVSTNSCSVNTTRLGKNKRIQLFEGDNLYFFIDEQSKEQTGFKVKIINRTGLFNGGERLESQADQAEVYPLTPTDLQLKPKPVADNSSFGSSMISAKMHPSGYGGNFNAKLRQQRKAYEISKSPLKSQTKRAQLEVSIKPETSWLQ